MSARVLRIGILGAARIADRALVEPALVTGDRVVAVAARDPRRARAFAQARGVERALGSYAELVADPDVDLVYNALPNGLHGPWNVAAIGAGKHVLGEKPFASNAGEARGVRDAADAAGVVAVEAFHYLHHPVMRRVAALLDADELGEVRTVEAHFAMPPPPDADPRWSLALAGGALMDLGCYGLHAHRVLGRWLGGSPELVDARGAERSGAPGVDEWMTADLAFPGGATGLVHCDMAAAGWRVTLRVVGSAGTLTVPNFVLPQRDDRLLVASGGAVREERAGTRSTYTFQLEALRAHLLDGAPFPLDADDAVAGAELIDAVYAAAGFPMRPRAAPGGVMHAGSGSIR